MKKLALAAAGLASVAMATPAQAATVIYTSSTAVGLIERNGIYSGAFEASVVSDAQFDPAFTANFTFTTPFNGTAAASAISIALNAASNLNFTSIAINGMTGNVNNGTIDQAFITSMLVPGGLNTLSISGLLNPPSGDGNASFGGNVNFAATAVPEPATWALFILGFGGLGYAMRRRNAKVTVAKAKLHFA